MGWGNWIMSLTKITLFKNTPFTNFNNTILFESNQQRDSFFLDENHYVSHDFSDRPFNFVRDKSTIDLPLTYDWARGVNYCTFISDLEPSTRYYAYVMQIEYINDNTTRLYLLIDGIMTFCQGNVLNSLQNLKIQRQHLNRVNYNNHIWELKNNDDILKTNTKSYFKEVLYRFDEFYVLFHCSADLSSDFGDVDNPLLETSDGGTFDKITSPVNLYVVEHSQFTTLMKKMQKFPWITQNITSIMMIPKEFLSKNEFVLVNMKSVNFSNLFKLRNNGRSERFEHGDLTFTMTQLYDLFDLDEEEDKHILRNEYTTTELYTFNGQQLLIDNGKLNPNTGLKISTVSVLGYENEIAFYPLHYRINNQNIEGSYNNKSGSFLNDSITLNNFDEIPILIDTYNLALAKNANQRELTESKLITNRLSNIFDPSSDLRDRFFDAASVMSNVSLMGLTGRFVDEYEYYREKQAQQADLALENSTVTQQSTNNSLAISDDFYGLTLKFSRPTKQEMNRIKEYYKMFGYYVPQENSVLDNIFSMTICNYVQFGGDWFINNVDTSIMTQIRALFENGIRFWHNNNTPNPMTQNILNNKMR